MEPGDDAIGHQHQGDGADETGGSVQDGTAGEVRVLALAESEQHDADELHHETVSTFS